MSEREDAIRLLKILGLTGLEAELYLLLLEKGPLSAPEISDYLVRHRPQIHVALTRLVSKGYVEELGGRPKKYRAVDPEILYENFMKDLGSMAKKALAYMKSISKPRIEERHGVWMVRDADIAKARMASFIDDAKIDVLVMGDIKFIHMLGDKLEKAADRGVAIYVLAYQTDERGAKFLVDDLPFLKKLRTAISGDMIVVVDSKIGGLVKSRPLITMKHGLIIEERALLDYLSHDFVNRWVTSKVIVEKRYGFPLRFTFHRLALYETRKLLLEDKQLMLHAKGYEIESGTPTEVRGRILDAVLELPAGYAHFKIDTGEKVIRVGGLDAVMEEVAGELFEISEAQGA